MSRKAAQKSDPGKRTKPTSVPKPAKIKPATQRKKPRKKTTVSPPQPAALKTPAELEAERAQVIEWFSSEGSELEDAAALSEWTDNLRIVRREPGYQNIAKQHPEESATPRMFFISKLGLY